MDLRKEVTMAITRWAPFSTLSSLEREMRDIFDRIGGATEFEWSPSTDVYREDGDLVVRAEIPGIDADGVSVEMEGNVLHISGEKTEKTEIDEEDRYLRECHYGSFRRDVLLPETVSKEAVKASFVNGVLTVRVSLPTESGDESGAVRVPIEVLED
jgi:HSP20 family protein